MFLEEKKEDDFEELILLLAVESNSVKQIYIQVPII